MKLTPIPIEYNISVEGRDIEDVLIDWGNAPGWAEEHAEQLEQADRIALIPKDGGAAARLPVVAVALSGGRRWVVFSRVFGRLDGTGRRVRLYAIGWWTWIGEWEVESINWIYPTGIVENAREPTLAEILLNRGDR